MYIIEYLAFNQFYRNNSRKTKKYYLCGGEMAEWSNAAVLKTVVRSRVPGVRIPLSPLNENAIYSKILK